MSWFLFFLLVIFKLNLLSHAYLSVCFLSSLFVFNFVFLVSSSTVFLVPHLTLYREMLLFSPGLVS